VDSRNASAPPNTSTEAWPGSSRKASKQVAAIGVPPVLLAMSVLGTYPQKMPAGVAVDLPEQVIDSR
jgi:hypothetical protein